jgi:hypothetical protein
LNAIIFGLFFLPFYLCKICIFQLIYIYIRFFKVESITLSREKNSKNSHFSPSHFDLASNCAI